MFMPLCWRDFSDKQVARVQLSKKEIDFECTKWLW